MIVWIENLQLQSSIGEENCKECSDTDTGTSIIGKSRKWYNNTGGKSYTLNENTGGHKLE